MALGDIQVVAPGGKNFPSSQKFLTEANTTVINAGEPVKGAQGTGTNFVLPSADAEPVTSAPTFLGIASSTSTQTASAAGECYVILAQQGMVYRAKAKSAAAVDTQAEINGLLFDLVALDLTAGVYTVETASAGATNGLVIIGGDPTNGTLDFLIRSGCTILA